MTTKQYEHMVERELEKIRTISRQKGRDYSVNDDRLSHFKLQAEALGLTPEQVWAVFAGKHFNAIINYCKTGDLESEPIQSRIHDLIVYSFLLLALIKDSTQPQT